MGWGGEVCLSVRAQVLVWAESPYGVVVYVCLYVNGIGESIWDGDVCLSVHTQILGQVESPLY